MSWAVVQSASTDLDPGTAAVTYSSNVSSGTKLICYICTGGGGNPQVTAVKDGALNAMTKVGSAFLNGSAANGELSIWAMDTPSGDVGTKPTITATQAGGSQSFGMVIQEVSGLAAGNTLAAMVDGTAATHTGSISSNGSVTCGTYSSAAANEFLVALGGDNEASTITWAVPTGSTTYTRDAHAVNASGVFDCVPAYGNSSGGSETGSFALTGVGTATPWATVMVAFQIASTALAVTTTALPAAATGIAYSQILAATGGTAPYTWSVSSGSLPSWASLNSSTGAITGTPGGGDTGSTFTVEVTDNVSATATQSLTLDVRTPVTLVGSVGTATATSGSVTGAYGQTPTADNVLVAAVAAGSTTAETSNISSSSTGWARLGSASIGNNASGTDKAIVDFWWKAAAGGDATPVFTQTLAGTQAMECFIYELAGADVSAPLDDASGVFQSGSSTGSVVFSLTSAALQSYGEFAISVMCQERATAGNWTWTETGSGWTSGGKLPAASSILAVQANSRASAGPAALTDAGSFSTHSTALGAGLIVTILGPVVTSSGVSEPFTETGSGSDSLSITAAVALAEAGTGSDVLTAGPPAVTVTGVAGAGSSAATTTQAVSNPAWNGTSTPTGQLILLTPAAVNNTDTFSCSGFTAVTVATGQNIAQQLLYRVTDGSEGATFTVTGSGSFLTVAGAIAVSGQASSPFDPSVPSGSGTCLTTTAASLPGVSLTTAHPGDLLVWVGFSRVPSAQAIPGITPPSGFVTQLTQTSTTGGTGHANVSVLIATQAQSSAGATGSQVGTLSAAANGGALLLAFTASAAAAPGTVKQIVAGAPDASSIQVVAGTSGATSCRLAYSVNSDMSSPSYVAAQAPDSLGYVRYPVTGLSAHTRYYVQVADTPAGGSESLIGPVGACKTLPAAGSAQNFTVALVSCINGNDVTAPAQDTAITDWIGYDADLNIFTGDFDYSGTVSTVTATQVGIYESQISNIPSLASMVATRWGYYCRSDHEAGPDNGDSDNAYTAANIAAAQEVFPFGTLGDTVNSPPHGLYQAWVAGRVRFIMIDIRNTDRSPGGNTDNSSKTMLGATQLAWLEAQLIQPEPLKVIISDVGWMGSASITNGPDKWWSYDTERQAIISYIAANAAQVQNVMLWHGDSHLVGCTPGADNAYGGFPVYCAAPLLNVGGGLNTSTFTHFYNNSGGECRQYGRIAITDNGTTIAVAFQGWDAASGTAQVSETDAFTALAEAGTGSDALAVTAAVSLAEAGTGTDALSITVVTALAEAGAGADALALTQPTALAEAGTGADVLGIAVPTGLSEAGAGSDSLALVQPTALAEAGAGSDSLGVMPGLSEAGAGADALSVTVSSPVPLTDAGTGSDALSLAAGVALAEAGAGADALAVTQPTALAEAGTGADALGIVSPAALAEAGAGSDQLNVTAVSPVGLTEAGAGADTLAILAGVAVPLTEAGSGADTLAITALVALTEPGAGTDQLAVAVPVALAEAGTGTDTFTLATPVAFTEAGSGADAFSLSTGPIVVTDADSCHAEDSGFTYVAAAADICVMAEGPAVIRISDSDRCTAADVSLTRWVRDTDACTASDLSLSANKSDSDGARATDGGERIRLASSDACTAADSTSPVGIWTSVPPFKTGPGGGWYEVVHSGRTVIRTRHAGLDVLKFARRLHEAREVRWVHDTDHSDFRESENHVTGVTLAVGPALELNLEISLIRADS